MPSIMYALLVAGDGALGPINPSNLGFDPFSVAAWVGIAAPFIVALALHFRWSSEVKFWVAVALMVGLSVFAWWTTSYPVVWELIATQLAIIFTASQGIYWALKPTGILTWLEYRTSPAVELDDDEVAPRIFPTRQSLHHGTEG